MPANDVHDRQHADENRLTDTGSARPRPGGSQAEVDEKFANIVNKEYQAGDIARRVRDAENQAALGKDVIDTGAGKKGLSQDTEEDARGDNNTGPSGSGKLAASKADANDKEKDGDKGFFHSDDSDSGGGSKKKKVNWKKRAAIGGASGLVGIGGFFGMGSLGNGPLAIAHFGQLLENFHLDGKRGQNESRLIKQVRYMLRQNAGTPERSRLGWLGNKYADRIEAKFKEAGVTPSRSGPAGFQDGYNIDPEKYAKTEGLSNSSPEAVRDYLQRTYQITANIDPATGTLQAREGGLFKGRALMKNVFSAVGWRGSTAMPLRFTAKRAGLTLHPLKALDRAAIKGFDARVKAFREKWYNNVEHGSSAINATGSDGTREDDPGKSGAKETAGAIGEITEEAGEVKTDPDTIDGKPGPLEKFSSKLSTRLAAGGAGALALLCVVKGVADNADKIAQINIGLVRERIGVAMVAVAGQVEHGDDNDYNSPLDSEQVDEVGNWLYDNITKTNATDARAIQAELGNPLSGPDLPEDMKIKPDGNIITRILSHLPPLDGVCSAVESTAGTVAITVLSFLTGPVSTIVGSAVAYFATQAGLLDSLAKWLAGTVIPGIPQGALLGSIASYGVRDAGSQDAMHSAGVMLTQQQSQSIQHAEAEFQLQEFQRENLATRLFDIQDRRSLIAQVYDQTFGPTPEATASKMATGFMNIGRNTMQAFGAILTSKVGAAPLNSKYSYDTPDIGHTPDDMTNPLIDDPYANADAVAGTYDANGNVIPGILDGPNGQDYKNRVSQCFGDSITMIPNPDNIREMLYDVQPPTEGNIPTYKQLSENNCNDQHPDWIRVRAWVWDTQLGNGWGCIEGDNTSCQANGIVASQTTNTNTGGLAMSCNGSGDGGGSIGGAGPLNDVIPANPVIDPASTGVVNAFPKPAYANLEAYGVSVICSGPSDPEVNVTSGNSGWGPNPFGVKVQGATGEGTCNPLHIPANAHIPSGTDGWVVVIDSTKPGLYCEMWVAKNNGGQWSMEYGGVYSMSGGGSPVLAGSGSGSNIPQSPILAREIQAGVINHALAFASPLNNKSFRPPASKTDGQGGGPFEEGMRFQLDPTFNCNTISGKGEKAICVALQKYGAYDVDNTGGGTGFFFQSNGDPAIYQEAGISGDYMKFNNIPMDKMRLLKTWQGN